MRVWLVMAVLSLVPMLACAHGSGLSLQKNVDVYSVDVHHTLPFQVGVPTWVNFFLSFAADQRPAGFTDVDVSLVKDNRSVFKTNVNKKRGIATGAIITFPDAGDYIMYVTYNNDKTILADTSFPIRVQPAANSAPALFLGVFLNKELGIGVAFGALAVILFWKFVNIPA